jgi:cellulase/cellobiase CelA1
MRSECANWCNIRGAGAGQAPTTIVNDTFAAGIDAYYWLKTPGESDGCTATLPSGAACSRYDSFCGSTDSIGSRSGEPFAPVAGGWFDYDVQMCVGLKERRFPSVIQACLNTLARTQAPTLSLSLSLSLSLTHTHTHTHTHTLNTGVRIQLTFHIYCRLARNANLGL